MPTNKVVIFNSASTDGLVVPVVAFDQGDGTFLLGVSDDMQNANVRLNPPITAGLYAAGNVAGGLLTIPASRNLLGQAVRLESVTIVDKSNQKPAGDIIFWEAVPTGATVTDHAAFVWGTSHSQVVGRLPVATADFSTDVAVGLVTYANLGRIMKPVGSANLYAAFVLSGAPTFASTSDLYFLMSFIQY